MLIGLVGDTHGNLVPTVETLRMGAQYGVELFISVGDFGYWPHHLEVARFDLETGIRNSVERIPDPDNWPYGDKVNKVLEELNCDLWFIDGNHEDHRTLLTRPIDPITGRRQLRSRIAHLPRGYRHVFDDHEWLFVGGAASIDRSHRIDGFDWFVEERITDEDVMNAVKGGYADVLVTHEGPNTPNITTHISNDNWPNVDVDHSNDQRAKLDEIFIKTGATMGFHGHHHHAYTDVYDLMGVQRRVTGLGRDIQSLSNILKIVDGSGF